MSSEDRIFESRRERRISSLIAKGLPRKDAEIAVDQFKSEMMDYARTWAAIGKGK